jgi:signal transduction histidine kinase
MGRTLHLVRPRAAEGVAGWPVEEADMERPIHLLFAAPRDRYSDLLQRLQVRYAVHQARDDEAVIEFADQARAAGRPYALAILATAPPLLNAAATVEQLRVVAPTTPVIALVPSEGAAPSGPLPEGSRVLIEPVEPATVLGLVDDVLEERAAHVARLRSEVVAPLAGLSDEVLRQPDLLSALRALYQQLAGLVRAVYFYVALYDQRRTRVLVPLTWDRGTYRSGAPRRHMAGAGLSDWVMAHDAPLVSGNLPADAARRGWPATEPGAPAVPTSVMVLPLRLGGQVIGVLGAFQARSGAFTQEDYQVVSFVADFMAGVVGHWWGRRQWDHEHRVLQGLDRRIFAAEDRRAVLAQTAEAALELTGMAAAAVIGFDPAGTPAAPVMVPADTAFAAFSPALTQLAQHLSEAGQGGAVDYTLTTRTLTDLGQRGVGRVVSYTLSNDGRADALLWLLHGDERPFDDQDQAALAAVARHGRLALVAQRSTEARSREQQVFARLAWRASVESSPTLLLSTALNEIRKLVPWHAAGVWQVDSALGVLRPLRIEGPLSVLPAQPLPLGGSGLDVALEQGGVQRLAPPPLDTPQGPVSGPALAVSLQRSQAQAIGVLVLERAEGAPDFSLRDETYLLNLAQLLVAGLERLRWQRVSALHKALAGALERPAPAVWAEVVGVVAVHLGSDTTAALVLDGPELRPLAVFAPPDEEAVAPWQVAAPLLRAAMAPGATTQVYSGPDIAPLGSLAVTPLVLGTTVLGALVAWNPRPGAFGAPALELLSQAAARVAPLVLMTQAGAGGSAQRRALTLFQTLHRDALTAPDVTALLRLVLMHALASTPATYGALFLREAGDVIKRRAEYPAQQADEVPREIQALAAQVTRTGQMAHQITDDRAAAVACVPLREGRTSIGALLVVSPRADGFTLDDLDLLTQLAALAADFISSRQSLEAGQALRSVTGLPVPTSRVLARLPALVCQALNVPVCLVHVLDRRRSQYCLAGSAGLDRLPAERADALALPAETPAVARFFATAGPQAGGESPAHDLWASADLRAAGVQFGAAQPVRVDGRPLAILSVHTLDARPLDVSVPRTLAALAAELGGTLEGLQQERRLGLLSAGSAALPHLPEGMSDPPPLPWPTTALAMLLDRMVGHIAQVTEAGGVYLLLRTDDGGVAVHAAAGGPVPAPLPAGIEALLQGTEPRHLADLRLLPNNRPPPLDPATRSSLVLPLVLHDAAGTPAAPLGVLLLESPTPGAFSSDETRLLRAQAALITGLLFQHGLAAQWLLNDRQARDLLAVLPALAAESDESRLYHQLVGQARETLRADLIVLFPTGARAPEVPPQSGNQGPGAVAGSPAVQALVRRVLEAAPRHPQPYFVPDVAAQDAGAAGEWLRGEGISALAFAPLVANGAVLGTLFAGWRRGAALDAARRQAVGLVAGLAAGVLGATREQTRLTEAIDGQMQSLSMAAHELREPLDKVHMIIETALNGLWLPMSDELRGRLSVAYTLLDNHYELLNRVMQLDQLRTGQQPLERMPVSLGALVQDVLSRYADAARRAAVQLELTVDPLLVPQRALLDPVLLGLALGNLVQNGIKFTPAGGRVRLGCTLSYTNGRALVFTVDDTGIGIPGDQVAAIFAPYYQVDRRLGRETRGLGLGLPIARLVAELHGGTLTVESRLNHGSRFSLRVPFQPADLKRDA